jgi:hypothetical protein
MHIRVPWLFLLPQNLVFDSLSWLQPDHESSGRVFDFSAVRVLRNAVPDDFESLGWVRGVGRLSHSAASGRFRGPLNPRLMVLANGGGSRFELTVPLIIPLIAPDAISNYMFARLVNPNRAAWFWKALFGHVFANTPNNVSAIFRQPNAPLPQQSVVRVDLNRMNPRRIVDRDRSDLVAQSPHLSA